MEVEDPPSYEMAVDYNKEEKVGNKEKDATQNSSEEMDVVETEEKRYSNLSFQAFREEILDAAANAEMEVGQVWCLIPADFWRRFERAEPTISKEDLGAISLDCFYKDANFPDLKRNLLYSYDYELLPKDLFNKMARYFGLKNSFEYPPVERKVICEGAVHQVKKVEVYLLPLLVSYPNEQIIRSFEISKHATVEELKALVAEIFRLPNDDSFRLYDNENENSPILLSKPKATLNDYQIYSKHKILIETKVAGEWPLNKRVTRSSHSMEPYGGSSDPGITGLNNLGNTCFMNSGLQCLSNTAPLAQYFLDGKYENDINTDNPLGMKGEIAMEFGELVKALWSGHGTSFSPRTFKHKLSLFAPQFSGYQQHDSQELLAFLLDGLHEDLNRIKKKPYIEINEDDTLPQEVLAQKMWSIHKQRNDSIIVDLFQGQFKSTLVCPECNKISVTFDPFMYLSLPLATEKYKAFFITVLFKDTEKPLCSYGVRVLKTSKVAEVRSVLSELANIPGENMMLVVLDKGKIIRILQDDDPLSKMQGEIWCYEVDSISPEENQVHVAFLHYDNPNRSGIPGGFGYPLVLTLPQNGVSGRKIYNDLAKFASRFLEIKAIASAIETVASDSEGKDASDLTQCPTFPFSLIRLVRGENYDDIEFLDDKIVKIPADDEPVDLSEGVVGLFWNEHKDMYFNHQKYSFVKKDSSYASAAQFPSSSVTLKDCLMAFTQEEKLGEDDPWYCPKCKKHQQATKKFDLWEMPKVLVVHLKRFSYGTYRRGKLEVLVDFPITGLDLSEYIQGPNKEKQIYDLHAISNHYGSLGGGHYTAYARNKDNGKWYDFDDSHVSSVSVDNLKSGAAYVLFYTRRDA